MSAKLSFGSRVLAFCAFLLFAIGIGLIATAFATEFWVQSTITNGVLNVSDTSSLFHTGLFYGMRQLNHGLGIRAERFSVLDELKANISFYSLGLWVSIIVFGVVGVLWSIIGVVFALINVVTRPAETIVGPLGLYVWATLSLVSVLVCVVIFIVQYYVTISDNVLLPGQRQLGFSSKNRSWLGYSFWLLIGSVAAFTFINFLLLLGSFSSRSHLVRRSKPKDIRVDGGILLY